MRSVHVIRWIENLKDSVHELYWFDVLGKGKLSTTSNVKQIKDWRKRKVPYLKGEHFLRKKHPNFFFKIQPFLEVTANEKLEQLLQELQPDLVHSFEMQSCSYPVLETMQKFPNIKWLYSCWGSDLFYYQNQPNHGLKIKEALDRIDYLHTDCKRDFKIAQNLGFKGKYLGVIPGGGGYDLTYFEKFNKPFEQRKIIIVKGYHHLFGRGLHIVKAIENINEELKYYKVVVFGAHKIVQDYIVNNQLPFEVYDRHDLKNEDVLKLMGQSVIYIGNNISDGMPNTLLEAIIMGAFPIQSNPGNVTAEIITQGKNGFLIENPNDEETISKLILKAIENPEILQNAFKINQQLAKERLEYSVNQQKIVALYQQIENEQCE